MGTPYPGADQLALLDHLSNPAKLNDGLLTFYFLGQGKDRQPAEPPSRHIASHSLQRVLTALVTSG
jgi:hypothetical protein